MAWSCGIVGLPNAGKSTLFKALTSQSVTIENYPFSTIDPNKAIVKIPDMRLEALADLFGSEKITPANIEVIDVAGLVKGASRGEGLGNQFLDHLRNVDLLIHVVAKFRSPDALDDESAAELEIVNLELGLADLEMINRRKQKVEPKLKSAERKEAQFELDLLARLENHLNLGLPLRSLHFSDAESAVLSGLSLLTLKKMIYVCNHAEGLPPVSLKTPDDAPYFYLCAGLEAEMVDLPVAERAAFMEAYGIKESRAALLLKECYNLLELATFYTVKGVESRAWVVPASTRALNAAGKVHSDMEKGFINVETFPWDLLVTMGGPSQAREKGFSRVEGRDYPVKDGEVLYFRFRT